MALSFRRESFAISCPASVRLSIDQQTAKKTAKNGMQMDGEAQERRQVYRLRWTHHTTANCRPCGTKSIHRVKAALSRR